MRTTRQWPISIGRSAAAEYSADLMLEFQMLTVTAGFLEVSDNCVNVPQKERMLSTKINFYWFWGIFLMPFWFCDCVGISLITLKMAVIPLHFGVRRENTFNNSNVENRKLLTWDFGIGYRWITKIGFNWNCVANSVTYWNF
ncbi:hypothetical protein FQA39_LY01891 [Lamprigera yunnana]|nr:hypothetical protein FQA39_LY01891 [Lamprigera yunnana]